MHLVALMYWWLMCTCFSVTQQDKGPKKVSELGWSLRWHGQLLYFISAKIFTDISSQFQLTNDLWLLFTTTHTGLIFEQWTVSRMSSMLWIIRRMLSIEASNSPCKFSKHLWGKKKQSIYIFMYIYIHRERERERYLYVYMYVCVRERETVYVKPFISVNHTPLECSSNYFCVTVLPW